ncbi:MAG: AraC family transcriptional regulator [Clostridiales bacterium]|nr:AraC family transcriptional regulator [Clostridiales bacterium]
MNGGIFNSHPFYSIDYVKHDSNHQMPKPHYHNFYELYILEQGEHKILINDTIYQMKSYDVALYKPNVFHKSLGNSGCARTCIYFTEQFLLLYFTERAVKSLLYCFEKEIITLNQDIFASVKKRMLLLEKEDIEAPNNRIFIYLADILNILNDSKENVREEHITSSNENFAQILSYINQNYNKINRIDEIAERFYISKYHLCHMFKKITGLTLIQYLNKIKIQNACDMLANTDLSILDIGVACGFNSSMYFCKVFKQTLAITPSEFRKNLSTI